MKITGKIENRKIIEKISEIKIWLFENINKIDKYLDRLTKKNRDLNQLNQARSQRYNYQPYRH